MSFYIKFYNVAQYMYYCSIIIRVSDIFRCKLIKVLNAIVINKTITVEGNIAI